MEYPKIDCYFLLLPGLLPLDLAGPLQVMLCANNHQQIFNIQYLSAEPLPTMKGGLILQNTQALPDFLPSNSMLIVPGLSATENVMNTSSGLRSIQWLKQQQQVKNLTLVTVCSGALVIAKAGWLKDRTCTTHHDLIERLSNIEPDASILENRLYIKDQMIWTSAGISSGIDMMLAILEQQTDAYFTMKIAREMVVYLRRSGEDPQLSPWLNGRNHLQQKIHQIQDIICQYPEQNLSIDELASIVNISSRHLTRVFKHATSITIQDYREQIKISLAQKLLISSVSSIEVIAQACGFQSARSFRRAWSRKHQVTALYYRKNCRSN